MITKNISWLKGIYIAHRGLHNIQKGIPENSMPAFDLAKNNNIAIELDIHIIKDNTIVVFHDNNLKRLCGVNSAIESCSYNDIKKLKLLNTDNYIPRLTDVFSLINGSVPIIIEIKAETNYLKCCKELNKLLKDYSGIVAIKSFNPYAVIWFKRHNPVIIRGMLSSDFENDKKMSAFRKFILSKLIFFPFCKPDFLSLSLSMLNRKQIINIRKTRNIPILGWTFKSKECVNKYINLCDSYICEEKEESYIS